MEPGAQQMSSRPAKVEKQDPRTAPGSGPGSASVQKTVEEAGRAARGTGAPGDLHDPACGRLRAPAEPPGSVPYTSRAGQRDRVEKRPLGRRGREFDRSLGPPARSRSAWRAGGSETGADPLTIAVLVEKGERLLELGDLLLGQLVRHVEPLGSHDTGGERKRRPADAVAGAETSPLGPGRALPSVARNAVAVAWQISLRALPGPPFLLLALATRWRFEETGKMAIKNTKRAPEPSSEVRRCSVRVPLRCVAKCRTGAWSASAFAAAGAARGKLPRALVRRAGRLPRRAAAAPRPDRAPERAV